MSVVPLFETKVVTLDGTGAGQVVLGPTQHNESWDISMVNVSTTQLTTDSINIPTVVLYRNSAVASNQIGGTFSGILDTAAGDFSLNPGEKLVAAWTGGDPGVVGTITVNGSANYPGNRWVG